VSLSRTAGKNWRASCNRSLGFRESTTTPISRLETGVRTMRFRGPVNFHKIRPRSASKMLAKCVTQGSGLLLAEFRPSPHLRAKTVRTDDPVRRKESAPAKTRPLLIPFIGVFRKIETQPVFAPRINCRARRFLRIPKSGTRMRNRLPRSCVRSRSGFHGTRALPLDRGRFFIRSSAASPSGRIPSPQALSLGKSLRLRR